MKLKRILTGTTFALLSACTSTPEVALSQTPKNIDITELDQYWIHENKEFSLPINPKKIPPKGSDGFVEIAYLIDSNGNLFNPKIIKSHPEGLWDYSGLKALKKIKYKKAESNSERTPVYVTSRIEFKF